MGGRSEPESFRLAAASGRGRYVHFVLHRGPAASTWFTGCGSEPVVIWGDDRESEGTGYPTADQALSAGWRSSFIVGGTGA
jgi:hypothetical protein